MNNEPKKALRFGTQAKPHTDFRLAVNTDLRAGYVMFVMDNLSEFYYGGQAFLKFDTSDPDEMLYMLYEGCIDEPLRRADPEGSFLDEFNGVDYFCAKWLGADLVSYSVVPDANYVI